ncbi:hypothetical protein AQF52_8030 [Streptomyces venezuelae]|uniref:hypothetical protein n=1 Tax=Streptomyces gardneri TaxID=66892 RepID=UPI0006BD216D|nr:hypothetical protein AQF52_8030 [Streptomyces venezuelae]QPK50200.1 hypothetical protein H4W23_40260 [Streptomyces gardneri]WRK41805.1 hypothetical protein U0M97_40510 [Streptomyces venezuelae]CUM35616.1 hypothetical protein BN2537_197 [Streptomyces venezuelae]
MRLAGGAIAQRTKRLPQPSAHTEDLRTATLRLLDAMEPVIDKLNARYGHRVAGPAAAYRRAS